MVGAKVNGKLVSIEYQINNGDVIQVITSNSSNGPSRDWLNVVKSTQARNKIQQWFKNELKDENIIKGKEMLLAYCKSKALNISELLKPQYMDYVMSKYGFHDWESVLAAIGHGGLKEGQIINKMLELYEHEHKRVLTNEEVLDAVAENSNAQERRLERKNKGGIIVEGIHDVAVRFGKCCSPIPGDDIIGYVTRGRGVSIHRVDCVNVINLAEEERHRLIEAHWQKTASDADTGKYLAEIVIYAYNRNGLLADIAKALTEKDIEIVSLHTKTSKKGITTLQTSFEISGKTELNRIIDKIMTIESVVDIGRTSG